MTVTNDEPMMTEREVAERTRTTVHMWRNRRSAGDGPPYLKVGRAVRYRARRPTPVKLVEGEIDLSEWNIGPLDDFTDKITAIVKHGIEQVLNDATENGSYISLGIPPGADGIVLTYGLELGADPFWECPLEVVVNGCIDGGDRGELRAMAKHFRRMADVLDSAATYGPP